MLPRQETVDRWSCYVLEGGWLLALALVPLYFNPFSARIFEPDKVAILRVTVVIMVTAGLIRLLNRASGPHPGRDKNGTSVNEGGPWRCLIQDPLARPVTAYVATFALATALSVEPRISLWGSYARADGLHTNLAYVVLFVLMAWTLRSQQQVERIISIMLYSALVVASYALLQRAGWDPLPWNADVPERVTSTLGNPIFVGAYLGMAVPLALMRLVQAWNSLARAPTFTTVKSDLIHVCSRVLLVGSTLTLFLSVIKVLAVVRDTPSYAWVLPGAIAASVSLWLLADRSSDADGWISLRSAAVVAGLYLVAFAVALIGTSGRSLPLADDRWLWFLASLGGVCGGLALSHASRTSEMVPSRLTRLVSLVGTLLMLVVILAAIMFTQSRGPWLGVGASLLLFSVLLVWRSFLVARVTGQAGHTGRVRALILGLGGATLLGVTTVTWLNTSDTPAAQHIRSVPYLDRLGRLVETESGTGLERRLFWFGDKAGGGAFGLLKASSTRLLYGWGPESLLLVYEPYYPPSLGPLLRYLATDRYLAPDRAHQAFIDILVTRGLLGFASYLAVVGMFTVLALSRIRRARSFGALVAIAVLSSVGGSAVEQLVGIPIAATILPFWVMLAITSRLDGLDEREAQAEPIAPTPLSPAVRRRGESRGTTRIEKRATPFAIVTYVLVLIVAVGVAWMLNLRPIYADMRFLEGRTLLEQGGADAVRRDGIASLISALQHAPDEDLYWLVLGQSLTRVAEQRKSTGAPLGSTSSQADVDRLLTVDATHGANLALDGPEARTPLEYAEAALKRAHTLSPLSKEYVLALARLNRLWFEWTRDQERAEQATFWYQAVTERAPHDIPLLLERARFLAVRANLARAIGAPAGDAASQASLLIDTASGLLPDAPEVVRARAEITRIP